MCALLLAPAWRAARSTLGGKGTSRKWLMMRAPGSFSRDLAVTTRPD
jgi:hypothetical protein